jgi:BMFP domain-containing protein YqiC
MNIKVLTVSYIYLGSLMQTNKELEDELNAYKHFFSSKYDTLERESSLSYQMLLTLKEENSILQSKVEELVIENKLLHKQSKSKYILLSYNFIYSIL